MHNHFLLLLSLQLQPLHSHSRSRFVMTFLGARLSLSVPFDGGRSTRLVQIAVPRPGSERRPFLDDDGDVKPDLHEELQARPVPTAAPTVATPTAAPKHPCPTVTTAIFLQSNKHDNRPPRHTASRPPSPSSTSSEDPVILRANVPILKKARPGHPPLRLGPPSTQPSPPSSTSPTALPAPLTEQHSGLEVTPCLDHIATANLCHTSSPATQPFHGPHPHTIQRTLSYRITSHSNSRTTTAFDPHSYPPPLHPAPQPLFPPLPPLPAAPLNDVQTTTLTDAILRIAQSVAEATAAHRTAS